MPNQYAKVEGHANLVRDLSSNAIINRDKEGYRAYIAKRDAVSKKDKELQDTQAELNIVRMELEELKNMVRQLLNKE